MKKPLNLLFWAPRILAILLILFLAIFSLDIFDENLGFWGTILGLFMHNLPSLVLLVLLLISWRRDLFGAIAFGLAGTGLAVMVFTKNSARQSGIFLLLLIVILAMPALLTGGLFALGWRKKKQKKP